MEQNLPVIARRIWNMVRVVYFMLRKGISKSKLMLDLNKMMIKRGKLAGKALNKIMFHHVHNHAATASSSTSAARRYHDRHHLPFIGPTDYEFSCSNSPAPGAFPNFHFPTFSANKRKSHSNHTHNHFFPCAQAPDTHEDDAATVNAVKAVLEMLNNNEGQGVVAASPALPGFGPSPMVRQLRITDSPFPLTDNNENCHVDKAAEDFIKKFYNELRLQKTMAE